MDRGPTPIGRVIDDALRELLGERGFDCYLVLCRQTQENRDRFEREVRGQFPRYFAEEVGGLGNRLALTTTMAMQARMRAQERVQREIGTRIADEEQRFKATCDRLFRWAAEKTGGGCTDCGQ
jgi:hypothetical protein